MKYNKAKKAYKESLKPLRKQFAETYKAKQDAIEQAKVLDLTTARAEKMARDASKRDLVIKNKALNEERLALFRKAKQVGWLTCLLRDGLGGTLNSPIADWRNCPTETENWN